MRKLPEKLSIDELNREVGKVANLLADMHERLPPGLPDDVQVNIVGAFKFMRMTTPLLAAAAPLKDLSVERTLTSAIPIIRHARALGFKGFGGECFAAAIALNRAIFKGKLNYYLAVNDALHAAGRTIGHASLYALDSKGRRHHIDADGRIKSDCEIESWGMLDPRDVDYQEIAQRLGIKWNEDVAGTTAMFTATESDVMKLVSKRSRIGEMEAVLVYAAKELGKSIDSSPEP